MPTAILTQSQQKVLELLAEPVRDYGFYLAGGTALALQLGHRRSADFDFFTDSILDTINVRSRFSGIKVLQEARGTLTIFLREVKVSFFEYHYPLLQPPITTYQVPLAHIDDISAMKISAIAGRGSKKDFIDLYAIVQGSRALSKCLQLFEQKFAGVQVDKYHLMKSLIYFDDAEAEQTPEMLKPVSWDEVKGFFRREVDILLTQP